MAKRILILINRFGEKSRWSSSRSESLTKKILGSVRIAVIRLSYSRVFRISFRKAHLNTYSNKLGQLSGWDIPQMVPTSNHRYWAALIEVFRYRILAYCIGSYCYRLAERPDCYKTYRPLAIGIIIHELPFLYCKRLEIL